MSDFWSFYISLITVAGIAGCAWLLVATGKARAKKDAPVLTGEGAKETTGHVWDGDLQEYNNPLPKWWKNLFWITILFSVLYLILYPGLGNYKGMLGWTSSGAYTKEAEEQQARLQPLLDKYLMVDVKMLAADPDAHAMGERLFLNYCAQCHGSDARGSKGFPNLSHRNFLYGSDPEQIKTTITNGRVGVMPALGASLGADNVKNVVAYVRSLSDLPNDSLKAQLGKSVFMTNCSACHGPEGKGNVMIGAPNLTDKIWLYGSSEATITEGVMKGRHTSITPGTLAMPAWKETLGEGKIHLLAAYVWSLANAPGNTSSN